MSCDHDWGPRLLLFMNEADHGEYSSKLDNLLKVELPASFMGYSTDFTPSDDIDGAHANVHIPTAVEEYREFVLKQLGYDIHDMVNGTIQFLDWLTFPEQKLLSITSGKIFDRINIYGDCNSTSTSSIVSDKEVSKDATGLDEVRCLLAYYPSDVWYYIISATWSRIENESHLVGRTNGVGDELGCSILVSRVVRDVMRLLFLYHRQYAPYPKWFGSAFKQLNLFPINQQYSALLSVNNSVVNNKEVLKKEYNDIEEDSHVSHDPSPRYQCINSLLTSILHVSDENYY